MILETKKILSGAGIQISPTCVRVPVLRAHSESIHLEFAGNAPRVEKIREFIQSFPGVRLVDDPEKELLPMPLEASEEYECLVGRIRKDIARPQKAVNLFIRETSSSKELH